MSAPKNNEFWKMRATHGRPKIFETPEQLWQSACEYFEYMDSKTWVKVDYKGKNIKRVEIPTVAPYSLKGFCLFVGANERFLANFEKRCKQDKEDNNKDFIAVIQRIRDIIDVQQFEGATVGAFNANIISRKLGLIDRKDVTTDNEPLNVTFSKMSNDDLARYHDILEEEEELKNKYSND